MLFQRRPPSLRRLLIVEDEPLVAFDNEHVLEDAGHEIVATVDSFAGALAALQRGGIDLIVSDVRLHGDGGGIDVAHAAKDAGVPVLFVTGACPPDAAALAMGCLAKPYSPRQLVQAIAAIARQVKGVRAKPVKGLTLFG